MHDPDKVKRDDGRAHKDENKNWRAPCIKDKACRQEDIVFELFGRKKIYQQENRQEV